MALSSIISLKSLHKTFGTQEILTDLSLDIDEGQFYSLIGESGSGKTTTLRLMNGLERPTSGQVLYHGQSLEELDIIEVRRSMGYCLQGYTLFPHLNIAQNITLVAKKSGWEASRIEKRLSEVMELLNFDPEDYLSKMPNQLSGGQQQRIGIARAIFMNPKILLMDEPFGALDPVTRHDLQTAFIQLQRKLNLSVVLVTHDISEAFKMSDKVLVLNQGTLAQEGRPNQLLRSPANEYVLNFIKNNSPGHILKELPLSSVLLSNFFVEISKGESHELIHCESGETRGPFTELEVVEFLNHHGQVVRVKVDSDLKFKSLHDISGSEISPETFSVNSNLLNALQTILRLDSPAIPVLNTENKVLGVFGREALDVLA